MDEATEAQRKAERAIAMAEVFGLRPMLALSQFESYGNENWLYEDVQGNRTVLRRYEHAAIPRVRFQVALLQHLGANDFPAPALRSFSNDRLYHVDSTGRAWAAFSYIEGRPYDFSLSDAEQAATALARFHVLGTNFDSVAPPLDHRPSLRDCWSRPDEDVAGLRALFAGRDLEAELDYLAQWWEGVLREWPVDRLDALPFGLVHGDYHGRNLAYAGDRLAGVFDFDDVEHGPLMQDVAMALYKFARESRFSLRLRPDALQSFLDAYTKVRPLTGEERTALPVFLAMQYPPNPAYYRYYRDRHGSDIEKRFKREVNIMRELRAQAELVAPS